MRPTRWPTLVSLLLIAAAVTWGFLRVADSRGSSMPPLPWAAPAGIAAIAAAVLISTIALRRRMGGRLGTKPPHPIGVARLAVLGKTASHVGPVLAGGYAGYLLILLPDLEVGSRRERAVVALVAVLAGLLLTGAGLLLERACRVPPPPQEPGVPTGIA
jgi:hypothetical protein